MRIRIGTEIDGHKVVEMLCSCGHSKDNHADKEVIGKRIKKGNQYITPITYEKNMGHCRKHKYNCYKYEVGSVLLDNGEVLNFSEFFKCDICKKILIEKKHKHFKSYWPEICIDCVSDYYGKKILDLSLEIESLEALKEHLINVYPGLIEKEAGFDVEYGYDYECEGTKTINLSILIAIDNLIDKSKKRKETWEDYI